MDTLAFWLPLLLLFITALLGTALKRKARDHCLKKFEASKVIVPLNDESWEKGILYVFAQGLELIYENPLLSPVAKISSRVLHPSEVCKIPYFIRPAPDADTRSGYRWWKELENPILSTKPAGLLSTSITCYEMHLGRHLK